ncbi:hypothetical protein BGZ94_004747 [Podila epigama]|nr:hypothetical protein BGZ94_004747 [Podila epigama]
MLGRDPTRIDFRSDYRLEMQRATEEYVQRQGGQHGALARAKERQRQLLSTTAAPPPTPAEVEAGLKGAGASSSGTSTRTSEPVDPVELAQREKRSKTTHERLGI